jgi:hypothetical protein
MPLPIAVFLLTSLLFLSSCAPNPEQAPPIETIIRPSRLDSTKTIPIPKKDDIILTISGKINATNQGNTLQLDRQSIEKLQVVEYQIFDLFEKKQVTFQGILLTDLIALSQPAKEAKTLTISAINDYQIDIPINVLPDAQILFALKQDGQYMQMNYRGPAMLIVPPDQDKLIFPNSRSSYWIWQIKSILVE